MVNIVDSEQLTVDSYCVPLGRLQSALNNITVNDQLSTDVYRLLLLVLWSEYCLMEEILLSDSVMKAFSFSSNS